DWSSDVCSSDLEAAVVARRGDGQRLEGRGLGELQPDAHPFLQAAVVRAGVVLGGPEVGGVAVDEAVLLIGVVRALAVRQGDQAEAVDLGCRQSLLGLLRRGLDRGLPGLLLGRRRRRRRRRGRQRILEDVPDIAGDRGQRDDQRDHHGDRAADDDPLRLQRALLAVPGAQRVRLGGVVVHRDADHVPQQGAALVRDGALLRLVERRTAPSLDYDRSRRARSRHRDGAAGDRDRARGGGILTVGDGLRRSRGGLVRGRRGAGRGGRRHLSGGFLGGRRQRGVGGLRAG